MDRVSARGTHFTLVQPPSGPVYRPSWDIDEAEDDQHDTVLDDTALVALDDDEGDDDLDA
ncbi:MAG: hypothetical protein AAGF99_01465 [Bacteroidota bacterium]